MNNINTLKKIFSFKKPFESLVFLGALLLVVLTMLYLFKINFGIENFGIENFGIENFENEKSKKLVYFYMKGCSHCEKFSPIWDEFSNNNKSSIKTYKLERTLAGDKINKYEVKGFPTILLLGENNEKIKEYDGDRTVDSLTQFVNSNK